MSKEKKIEIVKEAMRKVQDGTVTLKRGHFLFGCSACALGSLLRGAGVDWASCSDRGGTLRELKERGEWADLELVAVEEAFENATREYSYVVPRYVTDLTGQLARYLAVRDVLAHGPTHERWPLLEARVWGWRRRVEGSGEEDEAVSAREVGMAILQNMLDNEGHFYPGALSQEEMEAALKEMEMEGEDRGMEC